jgi:hypothetical protein
MTDPVPPAERPTSRAFAAYRAVLAGSTLGMVALSWPLWVGGPNVPPVPFLRGLPEPPAIITSSLAGGLVAGLALGLFGLAWRAAIRGSVLAMAVLVLLDQNRLQPWAYEYLILGLTLSAAPEAWGLRLCRLFLIALYIHSGLSKLDVTFADELGLQFLQAATRPLGLRPEGWPESARRTAALLMAGAELAVGVGLAIRRTRRVALGGAVALHLSLLGILGPWGLGHSWIVLAWNLAVLAEDLLLFGPKPGGDRNIGRGFPPVGWVVVAAGLLPFAERAGRWDAWPSFGLYASNNERTEIYVHESDLSNLPPSLRAHLIRTDDGPWLRLDATGWSREERGVPTYPSGRVGDAIALAIEGRHRLIRPIRVVQLGRADPLTGSRSRETLVGTEAIRRHARRYLLNAEPAGGAEPADRWGFGTRRAE